MNPVAPRTEEPDQFIDPHSRYLGRRDGETCEECGAPEPDVWATEGAVSFALVCPCGWMSDRRRVGGSGQ